MKSKWVTYFIPPSKAMQAVAENPGKAAPAGWKPGDKLIGTCKEFIGKY